MTDRGGRTPEAEPALAPANPAIRAVWCETLGVASVADGDDFFALGGDSLLAIRMLAAVESQLGVAVDFPEFVADPTVAALAAEVERAAPAATPAGSPAAVVPADGPLAATPGQERLWFFQELAPGLGVYNMPLGARIRGPLDAAALLDAVRGVVQRHDALRTRIVPQDGRLVQIVDPTVELELETVDLRGAVDPAAEAQRLADELASRPFRLEAEPPIRGALYRVGDEDHILQLAIHHAVCDGWSQVVVFRDLAAAYATGGEPQPVDACLPPVAEEAAVEAGLAYWRNRLATVPFALDLPTDRPRPAAPSYGGATHRTRLSPELAARVRAFARAEGATVFTTLLTAFSVLLHRLAAQDELVVGATTSGREGDAADDVVGLFANTVAIPVDLSDAPTFRDALAQVRASVAGAIAHQSVPFERIVGELQPERDPARHPIFQVFFAHVPHSPLAIDGAEPFDAQLATARFDLTLFVEEEADRQLELAWEYATDLFEAETIARFESYYLELLQAAVAAPERTVLELPLVDDERRRALLDASAGEPASFPVGCLHELFSAAATLTPDAPAVTYEGETLSYRDLDRRANGLAQRLRELGVDRETLVALCVERSLELVIAIVAILKAGGAYVPVDPDYPTERIAHILDDAAPAVLLTQERLLPHLPRHGAHTLLLDAEPAAPADAPPPSTSRPEDLAYVIYTSGSTGRPKGVLVEHRQVARLFTATNDWFAFSPDDTWLMFHSFAFDFSVWELWGALLHGGRLVVAPHWTTRSPQALAELVAGERVTVLNATPSAFIMAMPELLGAAELALRIVVFGGEALRPFTLAPWFDRFGDGGPTLVNMYGITETTVHVTYRPVTNDDVGRDVSPIGQPIPDLQVYVLDTLLEPVPAGVPGELFVGGDGVTRGYLNRPELTAERFLPNPFGAGRLYRSGDRARRSPAGELEYLGRGDDQVKVRGFRIELGEIEAALAEQESVAACAVRAVQVAEGDVRLAAWVVPGRAEGEEPVAALRSALEARLPGYMIPSSIVLVDGLPLTAHGKLDVRALPPPAWVREQGADGAVAAHPATETAAEAEVGRIWCEVLGVDSVAPGDNFFHLGGHSLLAARVATQIRQQLGIRVSVRALFDHPTLAALAAHVDELGGEAQGGAVAASRETRTRFPLSKNQQQLLFFEHLDPGGVVYNAGLAVEVSGPLDEAALAAAIRTLVGRHEALRTVFRPVGEGFEQVVLDDWDVTLPIVDAAGLDDEQLRATLRDRSRRPFDLERDLTLRATVFRRSPTEHVLLFDVHHIAVDGWAVEIIFREVAAAYAAATSGRDADLPELAAQYGEFALWQHETLRDAHLDDELDYWRTALAGAPTYLPLPTDRPRPEVPRFTGATHELTLGRGVADAILAGATAEDATPYMLLLAAFGTLLYRITGQDDILVGGPFANRSQSRFEGLVGYLANTLVVRLKLGGNPTFRELLRRTRETTLDLLDHQDLSFESIVDAVRPRRVGTSNPLFQVNFRVRVDAAPTLALQGTTTRRLPLDLGIARFDLALELHVHDDGVLAQFNYDADLFDRSSIERLASQYVAVLQQVLADPETRLLALEIPALEARATGPTTSIRGFRSSRGAASVQTVSEP